MSSAAITSAAAIPTPTDPWGAAADQSVPRRHRGADQQRREHQAAREAGDHRVDRRRQRQRRRGPGQGSPPVAGWSWDHPRAWPRPKLHRSPPRPERPPLPAWLADADRLDLAVYAAIAATETPALDRALSKLTRAADYSKLSLAAAAGLAAFGGPSGRRAAGGGLASLAVTAAVVNLGFKLAARRRRPDPAGVPLARQVPMPVSRSFPSGHSAAAFAFATGVGDVLPAAAIPLARARSGRRLLARPHRCPLPGRRDRGGAQRGDARAAHESCAAADLARGGHAGSGSTSIRPSSTALSSAL